MSDALASGKIRGIPGYEIQTAEEGKELTYAQREANWAKGGQSWEEAFDGMTASRSPRKGLDKHVSAGKGYHGLPMYLSPNPRAFHKGLLNQQNFSNIMMRESRKDIRGPGYQDLSPPSRVARPAPSSREVEEFSATPQEESLRGKATVQDDVVKQKRAKKTRGVAETKRGVKKLKAISPKSLPSSSGINI